MATLGAGPGAGVHPERAVAADAVEFEAVFLKRVFDVGGAAKFRAIGAVLLQHIITRLRARGTGFFGEL